MPWLTEQDLADRFGATDIGRLQAGGADVAVATADAEAECEGYLSRVILLPVVTPGAALLRIGSDIARYNLWRRELPDDHPAFIAYKQAVADLMRVAAGTMTLAGIVGTEPPTPDPATKGSGAFAVRSSARVFSDDVLGRMEAERMTPGYGYAINPGAAP